MVPIQCAGMGMTSPKLAVAVASAGGLGMMSGAMRPTQLLEETLVEANANVVSQIGVNFIIPFLEDESLVDIAAENARVVDFFFGEPDSNLIKRVHDGGALVGR